MNIDPRLVKWGSKRRNIEVLVKAIREIVNCCYSERVRCTDPPVASTGFLYSLGFHQYLIRSFWSELPLGTYDIPLYKWLNTSFSLEAEHIISSINEIECGNLIVPIDELDARMKATIFTPRSHLLYIRVKGEIGGNVIRLNTIRLAKLIETYEPGWVNSLLDSISKAYDDSSLLVDLEHKVLEEIGKRELVLSFILPRIPRNIDDLYKLVPVVRLLLRSE
ncbi:MAG: hypothetical protein F7B59_03540 [Desulfurococcales archaeon]|nr:hypothetical protein [Desulfurococcales archaeon]